MLSKTGPKKGPKDHFWTDQRWSLIRGTQDIEDEGKGSINQSNEVK